MALVVVASSKIFTPILDGKSGLADWLLPIIDPGARIRSWSSPSERNCFISLYCIVELKNWTNASIPRSAVDHNEEFSGLLLLLYYYEVKSIPSVNSVPRNNSISGYCFADYSRVFSPRWVEVGLCPLVTTADYNSHFTFSSNGKERNFCNDLDTLIQFNRSSPWNGIQGLLWFKLSFYDFPILHI